MSEFRLTSVKLLTDLYIFIFKIPFPFNLVYSGISNYEKRLKILISLIYKIIIFKIFQLYISKVLLLLSFDFL